MELIAYNFLVGERGQTDSQFDEALAVLYKWMKQLYGNNLRTVFEVLSKMFHYQEEWMWRGVRKDL